MTTVAPGPARAAIYCRISDAYEEAEGVGDQRRDGLAMCEAQGWQVVWSSETEDTFTDNDISAANLPGSKAKERPAFTKLLAAVERGEVDVIVCRDLSRWTRDPLQGMTLLTVTWPEAAKRNGQLQVWYFGEDDYGLGIDFVAGRGIKEARRSLNVAVEYVETLQKNTKTAKKRHVREGRPSGGIVPFGYRQDEYVSIGKDKGYWTRKIDPTEAKLIKQAVADVLDGKSAYAIACEWNAAGVPTHGKAKSWQAVSVRRVLSTPSIAGLLSQNRNLALGDDGQPVEAKGWKAIVPVDQWQGVCKQLEKNAASFTAVRPLKRSYLLRSVLVCGDCGRPLAGAGGAKMKTAYRCNSGKLLPGCGLSITAAWIETVITHHVLSMLDDPAMLDVVHAVTEAEQAEAKQAHADKMGAEAKLAELADMFGADEIDRASYVRLSSKHRKTIVDADGCIAGIRGASVLDRYAGRGAEWSTFDKDVQRTIIGALIESVTIRRAKPGARLPDLQMIQSGADMALDEWSKLQDRVQVQWRYSAIEPLIEQIGTGQALPHFVYQAAASHPALAAMDTAALEYARNLKVPAKVKAAADEEWAQYVAAQKAEAAKANGHKGAPAKPRKAHQD